MDEEKLEKVREYLRSEFPGCDIEEKHDFDLGAQSFKITQPGGTLLLKAGSSFIDDNLPEKVCGILTQWGTSGLLKQNPKQVLLLTYEGPQFFNRN